VRKQLLKKEQTIACVQASGHIRAAQVGAVLHITLNRPEARNAMSLQMVAELQTSVRRRVARPLQASEGAVRAWWCCAGAGGRYFAGADLKDVAGARMRSMQREAGAPDPIAEVNAAFGRLCVAYAQTPLAVVAVLEGTVMGGGFGLACVADVALADDSASFRLPETSLGVVPAQIAPFLVERLGYSQAKRLAVTGGRLDAAAARRLGLVHELSSADDLPETLNSVLSDILACAPAPWPPPKP